MREDDLVALIQRHFPRFTGGVGIGDDAAIIDDPGTLCVTTDMLVQDHDFTVETPLSFVARKSLAVNLSDLAAMGATPLAFTLSLAFPPDFLPKFESFISALAIAARGVPIELVGGDLSAGASIVVSITAFGRAAERSLLRSTARPGDRIYVSRPLGASAAGLALLQKGWTINDRAEVSAPVEAGYSLEEFAHSVIRRHLAPEPELALGRALAGIGEVHACIDISDGLSTDLHRLCRASGTGAVLDWDRIPAHQDLERFSRALGINGPAAMLHGGEEYALLFTSPLLESALSTRTGRPVYRIGRIVEGEGVLLERDGKTSPLDPGGYDHFAKG